MIELISIVLVLGEVWFVGCSFHGLLLGGALDYRGYGILVSIV